MKDLRRDSDMLKLEIENCYHLIDSINKVFDILQDHIHELSKRVARVQKMESANEK